MNRAKTYVFKLFMVFFIIIVLFLCIYANISDKEITNLAYVIALGIDKGEYNNLKLTVQFSSNVNEEQDKKSGSETSQSSSSSIISVECETIESGINLLNSYISRNINFSHCKMVIVSEELAKEEISKYLLFLCNNPEVSLDANFMISKCDAKTFLEKSNPVLESVSARYFEIAPFSYRYTGFTKATSLVEFYSNYLDFTKQPTAILGNVNTSETNNTVFNKNIINEDIFYTAGQTPIESKNEIEYMGLAVFKDGKYVGELNGMESICHLIITNKLKNCTFQIKNPKDENDILDINIESSKSKNKVMIINNNPYITIDIKLKSRISSVNRNIDLTNKQDIKIIEESINKYMNEQINNYLYKVSKQYNSDIDGFGKSAIKNFLTLQEWQKYNWLDNFGDSFFKIDTKTSITSGYKLFNH